MFIFLSHYIIIIIIYYLFISQSVNTSLMGKHLINGCLQKHISKLY